MATKPLSDLTATWNSAGTTFNAIKMNVTDTASAAASLLLDLQVGGTSQFSVRKDGFISASSEFAAPTISTRNNFGALTLGSSVDVILTRDAADILAQRRTTNAQTHRWYRSFTDTSNYSRIALGWSSSTAIFATEGAGTGSRGNIAFGSAALATSDTVGYLMIPSCAGAPTGVPADIPTGQVAFHYDSTNHKIYVYSGAWRSTAALT